MVKLKSNKFERNLKIEQKTLQISLKAQSKFKRASKFFLLLLLMFELVVDKQTTLLRSHVRKSLPDQGNSRMWRKSTRKKSVFGSNLGFEAFVCETNKKLSHRNFYFFCQEGNYYNLIYISKLAQETNIFPFLG